MNFIKTDDLETKDRLLKLGFQLISEESGIATFLNNSKISFESNDKDKFTYSNMLTI